MRIVSVLSALLVALGFTLFPMTAPVATAHGLCDMVKPLAPLPLSLSLDPQKVALGEKLFNDFRLSGDESVACATCHNLALGGVDHRPTSVGIGDQVGPINAPTVYNSGFNFRQFWDGRAATLEEQAAGPIENRIEMGATFPVVIKRLRADPILVAEVKKVYGGDITQTVITSAIATFERSLVTPSRLDRFLRGDAQALNDEEREGFYLFTELGCASCHQGMNVGGNMYQKFGIVDDYFAQRGKPTTADRGRFNVTGRAHDRGVFKVPSLRNVAITGPWLHDGSVTSLEVVVDVMARFQLGITISKREKRLLVLFLNSLTGEYRGEILQ